MADKEQIIIDGKGCRYRTWDKDCVLTGDHHGDNMNPCKFIDEKNCYYKQLQRSESRVKELEEQLKCKTQECKELKAYAQRQENQREEYYKEFLKKDKALEEIEKYFSLQDTTRTSLFNIHCIEQEIQNIINKAKGDN